MYLAKCRPFGRWLGWSSSGALVAQGEDLRGSSKWSWRAVGTALSAAAEPPPSVRD